MIDEDIEQTAALSIVDESDNVVSGNAGKYGKFSVLDGDGSGNLTNLFKADGGLTISETTGVISGAPSSYATLKVKTGKFRIKFTPTDNANLLDVYKNLSYTSTACSATINAYHTSLEFDLSSLPNPGTDNCPSGIPMPGNSGLKYTIDTTISNTAAIKVKDETGAQVPNLNLKYTIGTNSDTTDLFKAGGGLNINVDTGVISGKPTKGKTGGFKITATPKANTL
jgi:hypothetical protein